MTIIESLLVPLMSLAMLVGVFLVLRKPLLWYYKINKHLDNQQQIITLLQKMDKHLDNQKEIIMLLQHIKGQKKGFYQQGKKTDGNPDRKEKEA